MHHSSTVEMHDQRQDSVVIWSVNSDSNIVIVGLRYNLFGRYSQSRGPPVLLNERRHRCCATLAALTWHRASETRIEPGVHGHR